MDVTKTIFQELGPARTGDVGTARLLGAAVPAVLATLLDETANPRLRAAVAAVPPGRLADLACRPFPDPEPSPDRTFPPDTMRAEAIADALGEHDALDARTARAAVDRAVALSIAGIAEAGRAQGLHAGESLRMFARQAGSVAQALPAPLADALLERGALGGLGGRSRQALARARPAGGATERPGAPTLPAAPGPAWARWLIPVAGLLVLAGLAFVFLGGG